jgi:WD40 repeat protein
LIQESPTLELVSDCSRFVTQHFEVISTSSPHIYHSALALTPRESIIRQLFKSHEQAFVRVVHGVPEFWNSNVGAARFPSQIGLAIWSPCGGFIAIGLRKTTSVHILDSATLQLLRSLEPSQEMSLEPLAIAFSPDSRTLTSVIRGHQTAGGWFVVSWDLQTGGVIGAIEWRGLREMTFGVLTRSCLITYSGDGKLVAILSENQRSAIISIYDVVSGVYMHDVYHHTPKNPVDLETSHVYTIWTHGEIPRSATLVPSRITIREVGFTPGATLVEVETGSEPVNIFRESHRLSGNTIYLEFHPPSYRLALSASASPLVVWDFRTSRLLLHDLNFICFGIMTFSSDGRFFACTDFYRSRVQIWKETPNGYTIFQKLTTSSYSPTLLLSPNGESIIAFGGTTIQLWHTQNSTTTIPELVPEPLGGEFLLEFFPDRPLVAIARTRSRDVTVVSLNSAVPRLTINTSFPCTVRGLRLIGNSITVIGDRNVTTWSIPGGNLPPNAWMGVEDSTQTIHLGGFVIPIAASISPDFQYIAHTLRRDLRPETCLEVYCISTKRALFYPVQATAVWFAPGGHDLWCATENSEAKVFTVTQHTLHHTKTVPGTEYGAWGCPWGSSRGYQVTSEGWVLRRDGKRLLMLPPPWRSSLGVNEVAWNGKFLGLLHRTLPEPVILELEP